MTGVFVSSSRKATGHPRRWYATFVRVRNGGFFTGTVGWEFTKTTPEERAALEASPDGPLYERDVLEHLFAKDFADALLDEIEQDSD